MIWNHNDPGAQVVIIRTQISGIIFYSLSVIRCSLWAFRMLAVGYVTVWLFPAQNNPRVVKQASWYVCQLNGSTLLAVFLVSVSLLVMICHAASVPQCCSAEDWCLRSVLMCVFLMFGLCSLALMDVGWGEGGLCVVWCVMMCCETWETSQRLLFRCVY